LVIISIKTQRHRGDQGQIYYGTTLVSLPEDEKSIHIIKEWGLDRPQDTYLLDDERKQEFEISQL